MSSSTQAASSLAEPSSRGTLSFAYRRSVVALQNVFGANPSKAHAQEQSQAEREPLLAEASSSSRPASNANAGPSSGGNGYGATDRAQTPGTEGWERRVRKPKQVISPVRVEAKVWFANEVSNTKRC